MIMDPCIIGGNYQLTRRIGSGSFGEIFLGVDLRSNEAVAVKLERSDAKYPQLAAEYKVYVSIKRAEGLPEIRWFGTHSSYNVMVMDLLGESFESLFCKCGRRFSLKTVLLLAIQMLLRLEHHHNHHYIHRDIKPDNFLMGLGGECHIVHLIDMGLCKRYRDPKTLKHIPFKENKKMVGTLRYASINAHRGFEQSRRDDLESIGYLLLYFLLGRLPWQGLTARTKQEKYDLISKKKIETPINELCASVPAEFALYLGYCRNLQFEEVPHYQYLRSLFVGLYAKEQFVDDFVFDWMERGDPLPPSPHVSLCQMAGVRFDLSALCSIPAFPAIQPRHRRQQQQEAVSGAMRSLGLAANDFSAGHNQSCGMQVHVSPVASPPVVAPASTSPTEVNGGGAPGRLSSPQPALVAVQSPQSNLNLIPNYVFAPCPFSIPQVPNPDHGTALRAASTGLVSLELPSAPLQRNTSLGELALQPPTSMQLHATNTQAPSTDGPCADAALPPIFRSSVTMMNERRTLLDVMEALELDRDKWKRRYEDCERANQQLRAQLAAANAEQRKGAANSRKRRASLPADAANTNNCGQIAGSGTSTRKERRVPARDFLVQEEVMS